MDSKTLLLAVAMMYFVDVSNGALMCYNCTMMSDPTCGATLANPSGVEQVPCSGLCMTAKTTMPMPGGAAGQMFTAYTRNCEEYCIETCISPPEVEGLTVCSNCCNTDRCNSNYVEGGMNTGNVKPEPTGPTVKDMTTESSAINVVVNFATVFFLGFFSVTML